MSKAARKALEEQRRLIFEVAEKHPLTNYEIMDLGEFENINAAATWARKMENRGWLKACEWTVRNDAGGRPLQLYIAPCGWEPKRDNTRHERMVTRFCLIHLEDSEFLRGDEVDRRLRPDTTMMKDKRRYHLEIDCGTMHRERVQERWRKYGDCCDPVLIVTVSNAARGIDALKRLEQLIRWSTSIRDIALFATLEEVESHDPYDRFWRKVGTRELKRILRPDEPDPGAGEGPFDDAGLLTPEDAP